MADKPTIELPRLEREHPARYEARTLYVTMGAGRSLEAVSRKLAKSLQLMKRWSTEDNWTEHAAQYDQTVYTLAANEAADQYRADLAAHRKRASEASQALYTVAGRMLRRLDEQLTRGGIEMNAGALATIRGAMQTALDLEAHALGIDQLMPALTPDDSEQL